MSEYVKQYRVEVWAPIRRLSWLDAKRRVHVHYVYDQSELWALVQKNVDSGLEVRVVEVD